MRRALPVFVRNKENDKKTAMKKMNIRKLIKQMTTQQKLAQLTQLNAVYIQAGINDTVTGPKGTLSLTDEQLACIGSVLNFEGAENAKAI